MPDVNRVRTNSPRYPPPSTQPPNSPELRLNPPYTLPIILLPQIKSANRSNNSPIMNPPTPSVNSLELVSNIPVPVEPIRTNPVPENISSPVTSPFRFPPISTSYTTRRLRSWGKSTWCSLRKIVPTNYTLH